MSATAATVNQMIQSMGISAQPLTAFDPNFPDVLGTVMTHMGIQFDLQLHNNGTLLVCQVAFSYIPKVNLPPLFRRLLALNGTFVGTAFYLNEPPANIIGLRTGRFLQGMDLAEFKQMLEGFGSLYWQYVPNLIQEFQLPQQPV